MITQPLKFLLVLLFALGYFMDAPSQTDVDSSRLVRVLTYNILHGETMNGDFDLDLIAGVISRVNPDLVALQEVDFNTHRARGMDLVTELGIRTGMAPLFGRAMPYDGGEYGEGILSKYSFLSTTNHALDAQIGKEPRAALEVNVRLRSGDTVRFVGTHLDHTMNETDRINQALQLNALLTNSEIPTILVGDLNATPDSETMNILYSQWTGSFIQDIPTYPSSAPSIKIDYVLFRPANRWKVIEAKVMDEKSASDHCPVFTILELLPIQ